MRKIFEDLLDNIENIGSQVQRPSTDVEPEQLYDYILYVGHQTNGGRYDTKRELHYFDLCLEDLKGVMDVCLESYETDGVLYFQEDDDYRLYQGTKKLPEDELKRMSSSLGGMACYKVYFNFEPDIIKMLRFFYTVANRFNVLTSHSLQRLYTIDGKEVRNDIIGLLDRNFLPRFRWSDDSTKRCRKELIKWFWEENRVLELPDDPEAQIAFVDRKITRFVTKLQVLDDWKISRGDVD